MNDQPDIVCTDCGHPGDPAGTQMSVAPHCPNCGSRKRTIYIHLHDEVPPPKEMLRGKVKDKTRRSRDNPRVEFLTGDDQRKTDGKWMRKRREIDKDRDTYFEEVVDPDTGELFHRCEEPLSKHRGHGSAKTQTVEQSPPAYPEGRAEAPSGSAEA